MKILNSNARYKRSKLVRIENWKKEFNRIDTEVYIDFVDNTYDAIIVNYDCLTKNNFDYLKEKFGKVLVYSVKTDKQVKKLLKWGVDSMFVDRKEYFDIRL
jgi:glycerophosphoryl diester phosphodiesterase